MTGGDGQVGSRSASPAKRKLRPALLQQAMKKRSVISETPSNVYSTDLELCSGVRVRGEVGLSAPVPGTELQKPSYELSYGSADSVTSDSSRAR